MGEQVIIVPWVTARSWRAGEASFEVSADIGELLAQYGDGVYTIMLWGKIDGEDVVISEYSIVHLRYAAWRVQLRLASVERRLSSFSLDGSYDPYTFTTLIGELRVRVNYAPRLLRNHRPQLSPVDLEPGRQIVDRQLEVPEVDNHHCVEYDDPVPYQSKKTCGLLPQKNQGRPAAPLRKTYLDPGIPLAVRCPDGF